MRWTPALAIAALVAAPAENQAQVPSSQDSSPIVTATGTGEVRLAPDWAALRFVVSSRARTATEAADTNSRVAGAVLDRLSANRGPRDSVHVAAVGARPGGYPDPARTSQSEVSAVVRVVTRSLDRLSRFIDTAIAAGATAVIDVEFGSDRAREARREAFARAFTEARSYAEAVAAAAGGRLGSLVRTNTAPEPTRFSSMSSYEPPLAYRATEVSVVPREIVVQATVSATWRLEIPRR